ncbi:TraI domain protein, partial [Salmonella enterica subsp. enterica serovar Weltevreden]|nr:TraI domain protein [Salmonella enterica subsp. enterica serovar Weltevreden]
HYGHSARRICDIAQAGRFSPASTFAETA